ncbi:MAG: hypothetical protein H5T63_06415 [Chloroflexi bacterium]|nr:hypothetical protein [Chloroflexota bacterium]
MEGEFTVGQKVVHPSYGAGTVVHVRKGRKNEGHEKYYVIDIPGIGLTVHLPVEAAQEVGLREPVSVSAMERAIEILSSPPAELPKDYRERHSLIVSSMQSGEITLLAQVIRDLAALRNKKPLSVLEGNLFSKAKQQLASELAIVTGLDLAEAMQRVEKALRQGS